MYAIIDSDDEGWMDGGVGGVGLPPRRREKPPVDAEVVDLEADDATLAAQLSKRFERDSERARCSAETESLRGTI